MASIDHYHPNLTMLSLRQKFRQHAQVHRAHTMLYAAGLTALGLVAVAASMITLI